SPCPSGRRRRGGPDERLARAGDVHRRGRPEQLPARRWDAGGRDRHGHRHRRRRRRRGPPMVRTWRTQPRSERDGRRSRSDQDPGARGPGGAASRIGTIAEREDWMTPRDQHGGLPTAGVGQKTGFRPELQGLRALAVLLVVVYHVWIGRVSGGVDVFFFVSGYLLTGQLLRAAERGELDVRARWMRSLARLVPAAAVVLVATAGAAALVLPEGRWGQTVREIAAAALFLENWQLAADSVDYAARNNVVSVAQHFWSLSVQVQVFLLWPLLFAVVAIACRGAADKLHRTATLVLAGVFATSLVYSIELTITNQPLAYFHTLTRLWEFALGGLLALHGHRIALTRRGRVAAGWAGVVALVACGA